MNLDFNWTQPVPAHRLYSQLVVTTALILTFSPGEKGQRLDASLYAVMRCANPVAGLSGSGVQGANLLSFIVRPYLIRYLVILAGIMDKNFRHN
jgi:hypothetical protein